MSSFPGSPKIIKGGLVLLDSSNGSVIRVITLQYNSDTLSRTLQIQGAGGESGDRMEALRLKGPPIETIKLEAEIDATDQLEFPANNATVVEVGIHGQLAALESILYPTSTQLQENYDLAATGSLEIVPAIAPLTVFVWGKNRVVPVRITEFSVTEESFDTWLNPIRAKVSLGMRVLSINDLDYSSKGGSLFMAYHMNKEALVNKPLVIAIPSGVLPSFQA
jgi:hypothetical protein